MSRYLRMDSSRKHLRGVTLLELLVVISLVLVVSTIVLRSLAPALQSRNLREGSRLVNVFFNSARNRAMLTGRPAGVWIDRMAGLPEASINLYNAQIPEPYTGDMPNSGLVAYTTTTDWYTFSSVLSAGPPPTYRTGTVYNIVGPWSPTGGTSTELWASSDPNVQQVIRPGDLLRVNYTQQEFMLQRYPNATSGNQWMVGSWTNSSSLNWWPTSSNYNDYVSGPLLTNGTSRTAPTSGQPIPFQILRRPTRSAAGGIQLPDGVVIDLNYSGTATAPFYPRMNSANLAWSFNTYRGNPIDTNNGNFLTVSTPVTAAQQAQIDNTPIIIVFHPSGSVERVYCRNYNNNRNPRGFDWTSTKLDGTIFLLIGKREKLPVTITDTVYPLASNSQAHLNQGLYNWCDTENYWVAIRGSSGTIYTSANADVPLYDLSTNYYKVDRRNIGPTSGVQLDALNDWGRGARRFAMMMAVSGGK